MVPPEILRHEVGGGDHFRLQDLPRILEVIQRATAIVVGPGIGRDDETSFLVSSIVQFVGENHPLLPLIIDADALTILSDERFRASLSFASNRFVITPHYGEAARLLRIDPKKIKENPVECARLLSNEFGVIVVLKGAGTVIAEGDNYWIVPPSTLALATAGSGDVLAGIIGSFCAQARAREIRFKGEICSYGSLVAKAVVAHSLAAGKLQGSGLVASDIVKSISKTVVPVVEEIYIAPDYVSRRMRHFSER
jgi:NAD(P)H-hydrate epimerase